MVKPTYSKSHGDWEDVPDVGGGDSAASFMQVVFGSCSGVMDAASQIFSPAMVACHVASPSSNSRYKVRSPKSPKSRRSKSPSLRKSEEVVEIPEFLNADISRGHKENRSPNDDYSAISAISSQTLDEMAKQMAKQRFLTDLADKKSAVEASRGAGPPSPTMTEVSENELNVPGYNYIQQYDMETAPLSGMVLSPGRTDRSDASMSSIGFISNSERQDHGYREQRFSAVV